MNTEAYTFFARKYDEFMRDIPYEKWAGNIAAVLTSFGVGLESEVLDKTTPRLIQFHTLKNAANPPFLGGFSIFGTVAAEAEQRSCQGDSLFSMILCNDRKAIVTE